ncbi:MAG: hypothetical protein M3P29_08670 [Acidobacteriota bacterium]|nr:hypothetical protein [Acidobacteriota bacterium]
MLLLSACTRPVSKPDAGPVVTPPALEPLPPTPATSTSAAGSMPSATPPASTTPPVEPASPQPVVPAVEQAPDTGPPTLEQAAAFATNARIDDSRRVYLALLNGNNASRDTIAAAATGLYRISAYADAAGGFRKLGTFAHGEEDLRFYNAVSLFETGRYFEAKLELACALPFIQLTTEVSRYRAKIEQMAGPLPTK